MENLYNIFAQLEKKSSANYGCFGGEQFGIGHGSRSPRFHNSAQQTFTYKRRTQPWHFLPEHSSCNPYITSQDRRFRCLTFSCIKCYRVRLITIEEYSCVSNTVGIKLINLAITVNKRVLTFTIFLIYAWALLFSAFLFTLLCDGS